jgi:hypothetical protein
MTENDLSVRFTRRLYASIEHGRFGPSHTTKKHSSYMSVR